MTAQKPPPDAEAGPVDWAAALDRHQRWLRAVVVARVGDWHAADEVLQEVALAAVKQNHRIAAPGVSAWLYRVAVRQSLLYRRRVGRESRRCAEYGRRQEVRQSDDCRDPAAWLLSEEESAVVRAALLRLSRSDRELLLLKYTQDWTCKELAERLGLRVTTVETRLMRARERLRRELAGNGERPASAG
jgi:RNA polymerase sigma-70 factor (ECF subfamily)